MTDPDRDGEGGDALASYMQALNKSKNPESEPAAGETAALAQSQPESGGRAASFLDGLEEEFGLEPAATPAAAPSAAEPADQGAFGGTDDSMDAYREALKKNRERGADAASKAAAGPSGGDEEAMNRYREALDKKRDQTRPPAEAATPAPLAMEPAPVEPAIVEPAIVAPALEPEIPVVQPAMEPDTVAGIAAGPSGGADDSMDRYLAALNKTKGATADPAPAAEAAPAPTMPPRGKTRQVGPKNKTGIFQRGLDRLKERGVKPLGERKRKPKRKRAAPDPAPRRKPKAAARGAGIAARLFGGPAWLIKGGTLLGLLAVALMLQVMVYTFGGLAYVPEDLAAGATVLLPVVLLLVLVEPGTPQDWLALLASAAAVAVTGSLGVALGLSLLQIEAMRQAAYLIQLVAHLTILTVLWGPVFLMIASLLERRDLLKLTDPLEP